MSDEAFYHSYSYLSPEVRRMRQLFASSQILHPFLKSRYFERHNGAEVTPEDCAANFTNLADALATCCGARVGATTDHIRDELVREIGPEHHHIILILCDGMGNNILEQCLPADSFLRSNNQSKRLNAVFPSTTPAALTTLATAQWPGQHGVPGWDLREQVGCDFPGGASPIHQIRILAHEIWNCRSHKPAQYDSWDDVFLTKPWSREIRQRGQVAKSENNTLRLRRSDNCSRKQRKMIYVNAYNGDHFPSWFQGKLSPSSDSGASGGNADESSSSEFSAWQTGLTGEDNDETHGSTCSGHSDFHLESIQETAFSTLGKPEGSRAALDYFRDGIEKSLNAMASAEDQGQSTFVYLYTAHPDKHMHALGIEHPEVHALVQGIDSELERIWHSLGNRDEFLAKYHGKANEISKEGQGSAKQAPALNATLLVVADHGHITVQPCDMVELPSAIVQLLEYANIGVLGKGRHAYLHCKAGLEEETRRRWRSYRELDSFILLSIEEATDLKLFGPEAPTLRTRPRMGDFVAIAVSNRTLVTPRELERHGGHCQGAHGSLLPSEMSIPFVLCTRAAE